MKTSAPKSQYFAIFICGLLAFHFVTAHGQTFTGEGDWKSASNWSDGSVPADGATVIINGIAEISENVGVSNSDNPARIIIGEGTTGTLNVTGGTLSGVNAGSSGIFIGAGAGGVGTVTIQQGAGLRSQGANMVVQIGDDEGGRGSLTVAGELLNFKFFRIINGTLEMLPSGINNRFNQLDTISTIESEGTLSFVIDGDRVGALVRANSSGLNLEINPGANLKIALQGDFNVNDSWVLMEYTSLFGEFSQGTSFTNEQGFAFRLDYGTGQDSEVVLTLTSTSARPTISSFSASPAAIAGGGSTTLSWNVSAFTQLAIDPEIGDVSGDTSNGTGSKEISPATTTTYTLTLDNNGITANESLTVVVDEPPVVGSFTPTPEIISPGDTSTLTWDVFGAETISIDTGIGDVTNQSEAALSPSGTTTYRLTASNVNGSSTAEATVIVDALRASMVLSFDASAPNQANGAFADVIGGNSFDLKLANLDVAVSSLRTTLTSAYRLTGFGGQSAGDGNNFPGGTTSYETWIRTGDLDSDPQVIFEHGSNVDGSSLMINRDSVQFLNSQNGERTHELEVPLEEIDLTDFIQIVVTLDGASGVATLYVREAGGGFGTASATGEVGKPNGRASLFSWTNFSAAIAAALGGIGSEVPEGATQFRGEMALLNVFDKALSADEALDAFNRIAIADPELIQSFSSTQDRVASGDAVTFAWEVGAAETLTLSGGHGDVTGVTVNGVGSLEVHPTESTVFTLVATNSEGTSIARQQILVDVAPDTVVLSKNADSWDQASVWSDGQAAQAGKQYLVTDFIAPVLSTPMTASAVFPGSSLELLGSNAQLLIQNEFNTSVQIGDLRLNGGAIVFEDDQGLLSLSGGLSVLRDSRIDIRGTFNTLELDSTLSGAGAMTVDASNLPREEPSLLINGGNSSFSGGWRFLGGNTLIGSSAALGSGDIDMVNASMEISARVNNPDTILNLQGDSSVLLFDSLTFKAINFIFADGTSTPVPAGTYDFTSWTDLATGLGLNSEQLDIAGAGTVTVLEESAAPIVGTTFTGEGDWSSETNWSDGIPTDGSNAIVNGVAEISGDIGVSNTDNPSRIFVGDHSTGVLNVTGGTLSGAHTGADAGLFVGIGQDGNGTINIFDGAALRSQGGGMVVQVGDDDGGVGRVSIAGQLFNFKFFRIINGTLEMQATGINNSFNSNDISTIESNGTLAFAIDGNAVGTLQRANETGLVLEIDAQSNLEIALSGNVANNDSWTLIDYTTLTGQFSQGSTFTNGQGHQFDLDYGSGDNDVVTLTLAAINPNAAPPTVSMSQAGSEIHIEFTGTLESAMDVTGPFSSVAGASSPFVVSPDEPVRFYRASR